MEYGVYGRVLFCGQLEKRRDGAVRGGWASRLFLLTPDALHYFRKVTDLELLGEERGKVRFPALDRGSICACMCMVRIATHVACSSLQLALSMIKSVRAMPEDEVPVSAIEPGTEHYYLEIATETRSFLMRTPVSEASTCESWSIAIEEQRKAIRAEQTDQRECTTFPEAMPSPTLLARNHELFSLFETSPPRIAMISVVRVNERDAKPLEEVIKRKVAWGEVLDLGVVPQGGACVILLQDGGIGRIGTQALMGSWDAGQACWIEVTDAESPTEIEGKTDDDVLLLVYSLLPDLKYRACFSLLYSVHSVSVTCKVVSQAERKTTPRSENSSQSWPKWVEWTDEGSSVGFLLMCLFVHLLYGVDGFHWSHKCCLTVGAALAISTILNGSSRCVRSPF